MKKSCQGGYFKPQVRFMGHLSEYYIPKRTNVRFLRNKDKNGEREKILSGIIQSESEYLQQINTFVAKIQQIAP